MALKKNNNRMIILCGGRGRRMGKLTSSIPKPMVKIGKSSIIEHKIKYYQSQGIENFTICLGYKSKILKKHLLKKKISIDFDDAGINPGILKRIFSKR